MFNIYMCTCCNLRSFNVHSQLPGEYTMEYSRYSPCSPETHDRVVQEYQKKQEAAEQLLAQQGGKKKKKN